MFQCLNASCSGSSSVIPKLHVSQNTVYRYLHLEMLKEFRYQAINIQSMLHIMLW